MTFISKAFLRVLFLAIPVIAILIVSTYTIKDTKLHLPVRQETPKLPRPTKGTESMELRKLKLETICKQEVNSSIKVRGRGPVFFYSKTAKLVCCKAPKTGSSFWGTVILAIESSKSAENTFHMNRNAVHGRNEIGSKQLKNITNTKMQVMVSRDPYTRLFSAFIDKYYLLGRLGRDLQAALKRGPYKMNGSNCGYDVSFPLFVEFVVDNALKGKSLNEHFLPIVNLCDPCRIHYDVISRQESLTDDTRFIMNKLNISESKKQSINTVLRSGGIKNTIYSLVSSHLGDYNTYRNDCPERINHFEKVWKSFQIQGYVNAKIPFPRREFQKLRTYDAERITSMIVKEIEKMPLSKEDKAMQRDIAVELAYKDVPQTTIDKILKVYKMDFLLFGYDMVPPHKRPGAVTL